MVKGVIYIDKTGVFLFEEGLTSVVSFSFSPEIVKDLDILKKDQFDTQGLALLETNKVLPARFIIALSDDILFIKDLPHPTHTPPPAPPVVPDPAKAPIQATGNPSTAPASPPAAPPVTPVISKPLVLSEDEKKVLDQEVQSFLDTVPFENVGSKVIKLPTATKIVATNSDLYTFLKRILEKKGCIVESVVPVSLLNGIKITSGFTVDIARVILNQSEIARQNGLLVNQQIIASEPETVETPVVKVNHTPQKPSHKREFMLLGVFGVLLLILGYMVYTVVLFPPPEPVKKKAAPRSRVTPTPTIAAENPVGSASAALEKELVIQILLPPGDTTKGTQLLNAFTTGGYKKATSIKSGTSVARSLILFAPSVGSASREVIVTEVRKIYPGATTQESTALGAGIDVRVTLQAQ